jgi:beta-glucosidase
MQATRFVFPKGFVWGAATSAFQVEGSVRADGRGASIWDRFTKTPGCIQDGDDADDACRHYDLWRGDLALVKELGLRSYRFSIAWPRVIPGGTGRVNSKGLDFYERLVDTLLEGGIRPAATLYHWDLPQALEDRGGWHLRDTAYAYEEYVRAVLKRLGDRPMQWATFNEPQVFVYLGYGAGRHAPGRRLDAAGLHQTIHHVLLAHGLGMRALRQLAPGSEAGIVFAPNPIWPASSSAADLEASHRHWQHSNDWWTLPLIKGAYPPGPWADLGRAAPRVEPGDLDVMATRMDFLGLNYYSPARTQADASCAHGYRTLPMPADAERTDFPEFECFPQGLENLLVQFTRRYGPIPLYVTENGMSISSGDTRDPRRIEYLERHLAACHRAMARGVDLRGYFVWSFMDNFEWAYGNSQRFGLVHVDYKTFKRSPKDSYYWYQRSIRENGFAAQVNEAAPDYPFLRPFGEVFG